MLVKMRQVQKISREDYLSAGDYSSQAAVEPSETTRQAPRWTNRQRVALAYLNGALGDASRNKKSRIRYAQKYPEWLEFLQQLLAELGSASWIYKEGKDRQVFILETCCPYLDFECSEEDLESRDERIAYIQGFFDAEGGVPHSEKAKFYIQLVQKDRPKIEMLVRMLTTFGISTGKIHNPSVRVDPEYWRVFISTRSHSAFAQIIGSRHPVKGLILQTRMKI